MTPIGGGCVMTRLNTMVANIAAENRRLHQKPPDKQAAHPFITISREAGAGGEALVEKLLHTLRQRDPADPPWHGFDRELVEKVAEDHHLSRFLIESLEDRQYHWLRDLVLGFNSSQHWPSDTAVYRRVAKTIWALAKAGRVVIVGRGGVFFTKPLHGGIHIRLVAPFDYRVQRHAKAEGLTKHEAERAIRDIEQRRASFYKRFWPDRSLGPDNFTATFNTSLLDDAQIVEAIADLIPGLPHAAQRGQAKAAG